ncbi:MAG: hypothetical protein ABI353_10850, partial [Isosphaeraceae bacterium]
ASEKDVAGGLFPFFDNRGTAKDIFDFENAAFDHALFLLGIVVLGIVLAGALLLCVTNAVGHIHGASDSSGAFPKDLPCTPDDISATMFHCLGIDPGTELRDSLNRPIPVSYGSPILPLLA